MMIVTFIVAVAPVVNKMIKQHETRDRRNSNNESYNHHTQRSSFFLESMW